MRILLLITLVISLAAACNDRQLADNGTDGDTTNADATESCEVAATVIDMTELDGCRFMMKLEDGKRIQPVSMPEVYKDYKFTDGEQVRMTYVPQPDMMGICMSGTMAKITCFTPLKDR